MCPILAAVNPGSVQTGKRKFLGPPLKAAGCGKNGVEFHWISFAHDLPVRLSIHGMCAARARKPTCA